MPGRWRGRSPWWRARRAAPGAASPSRSARRARPSTAPGAPRRGTGVRVRPARDDRGDRRAGRRRGRPGIAVAVDHLEPDAGRARSSQRIDAEQGRLDVLVNDIWGGEMLGRVGHAGLGARPRRRAADAAPGDRHAPDHQPLRAAAADPPARRARRRGDRRHARVQRRALPGLGLLRPGQDLGDPARLRAGAGARAARLHRRRAHAGVDALGDDARELRGHRGRTGATRRPRNPHFAAISETPRFVGRAVAALAADPDVAAPQRRVVLLRRPGAGVRLHRRRRLPARLLALPRRGPGPRAPPDATGYR